MGRTKFWRDDAERCAATKIRFKHPKWDNDKIKGYLRGKDIAIKEADKKAFIKQINDNTVPNKGKELDYMNMPLQDLIDERKEPTGYISQLPDEQWINYYLGDAFLEGGTMYDTQIEISDHLDTNLWAAIDVWRGVGKTRLSIGKLIRLMCDNPNIKLALITEEATRSEQRVGMVKQVFQTNPRIIHDYGYLPHDKTYGGYRGRWSNKILQLKRKIIAQEPTLIGISQGSSIMLGYHFDGVLIDDPWSPELQRQKNAREKWMTWFQETFMGCMEKDAFAWMLFTRKGVEDLYQDIIYVKELFTAYKKPAVVKWPSKFHFEKKQRIVKIGNRKLKVWVFAAIVETDDWEINDECHGRFSIEFFLERRRATGNRAFEQEFQCNPISLEGQLLKWANLKMFPDEKLGEFESPYSTNAKQGMVIKGFMDQGFGFSEDADYTVLAIVGEYGYRYYVLQLYRGRFSTAQKAKIIEQAYIDFPKLQEIGIDSAYYQHVTVREIKKLVPRANIRGIEQRKKDKIFNMGGVEVEFDAKILRIMDQLEVKVNNGKVYVNKEMNCFFDFKHEFSNLGQAKHDDIPDAVGQTIEMLSSFGGGFAFCITGSGSDIIARQF